MPVEALGADSVIEVDVFGTTLAVKISADRTPEIGARVCLFLDPKHVYIFDRDSGERLRAR
jgi:ABC-type sugar transport system ATPase subunit